MTCSNEPRAASRTCGRRRRASSTQSCRGSSNPVSHGAATSGSVGGRTSSSTGSRPGAATPCATGSRHRHRRRGTSSSSRSSLHRLAPRRARPPPGRLRGTYARATGAYRAIRPLTRYGGLTLDYGLEEMPLRVAWLERVKAGSAGDCTVRRCSCRRTRAATRADRRRARRRASALTPITSAGR